MSRFDAMQHFIRVADLGSFAAAADQLGVARSVVTRRIVALEEHLGVKLITRTTRKLTLTSAGVVYLERCRRILQAIEEGKHDIAKILFVEHLDLIHYQPRMQDLNRTVNGSSS